MSNSSVSAPNTYAAFGAADYALMGAVSGVSNLLIALSIAKYSALRQLNQYIILMALAFADAVTMFGYLAAGIYRLWLITSNRTAWHISARMCLLAPHLPLWLLAEKFSHLMLAVISLDRLFLVAMPEIYVLQLPTPKYAVAIVLAAFGFTSIMSATGVVAILIKDPSVLVQAVCYFPTIIRGDKNIWAQIHVFYHHNISSTFALISVVIFGAIWPIYKIRNGIGSTSGLTAEQRAKLKSQRKMTNSLAISCACTLLLFCIPYKLFPIAWSNGYYALAWFLIHLTMTNSLMNIFIYQLRHSELREALKGLFLCKQLPPMLNLWKTHTNVVAPQAGGQIVELVDVEAMRPNNHAE